MLSRAKTLTHCQFLFNQPTIPELLQVRLVQSPKVNFYKPDALLVVQSTATMLPRQVSNIVTVVWAGFPSGFKGASSCDNHSVSDLQTAYSHRAVMVSQEHCCGNTFYRAGALPVAQLTASKH